jgi:hypothetical protein
MFTDGPSTPARLEILLGVVASKPKGLTRKDLYDLMQPESLRSNTEKATNNVKAGLELELLEEEKKGSIIRLHKSYDKKLSARENILMALDGKVLKNSEVELHLALFYAYYLGLNTQIYECSDWDGERWSDQFNTDVFGETPQPNRFNNTKYTGIHRWLSYIGLGWYDSNKLFNPDPTERILRSINSIFGKEKKITGDQFMSKLADVCPELDGGKMFLQANKNYDINAKECTLGLSQALVGLHEDGFVCLHCPIDSRGWNLGKAKPGRDDSIKTDRLELIEIIPQ